MNYKKLNNDDMAKLIAKYSFKLEKNIIITFACSTNGRVIKTAQEYGKPIRVRLKNKDNNRYILITRVAQEYWKNNFTDYNLVLIQNCINGLILSKQEINENNIKQKLDDFYKNN